MAAPDNFCDQGIARAVIQVTSAEVIYGKSGSASLYGDHMHGDHLISRYRARQKSALCAIILVRSEAQVGKAL